jgi:tetrahydromethanopterin S-methyltransferase subunit E
MNWFRSIRCLVVVLTLVGIFQETASAQNGRAGSNASQAVLNSQVQVVPTAMLTKQIANPSNSAVSYDIPVARQRLRVTEKNEVANVSDSGKVERHIVNIVTVVAE